MSMYSIINREGVLTARQREYLKLRFGFETTPKTRGELAAAFGITVGRCLTIERRAFARIRRFITTELRDEIAARLRAHALRMRRVVA